MSTFGSVGVDIDAATAVKETIGPLVEATHDTHLMQVSRFGQFASLVRYPEAPDLVFGYTMDGVGTKLQLAIECGNLSTIGECLVSHCVNDLLTARIPARVLLDYVASGVLQPRIATDIVASIATACKDHGIALVGGEMAEMPTIYAPGKYDLVATLQGMAPVSKVQHGLSVEPDMIIWGLPSSGPHNNGYSLIRHAVADINLQDPCPEYGARTWAEVLLQPTRCYSREIFVALDAGCEIAGMANITGGGIEGNLIRILPEGCRAQIDCAEIEDEILPIFPHLQRLGNIPSEVMWKAFNMGIGYIVIASADAESCLLDATAGELIYIGMIESGERGVDLIKSTMW